MQPTYKSPSRKKILLWAAAILSSITLLEYLPGTLRKKKTTTVKMLTQDGKLVEIDKELLAATGNKISDKELQEWIKK